MPLDPHKVTQAEHQLSELLGPELNEIITAISQKPGPDNPYLIQLPEAYNIDLPLEELASLVARTSNALGRVARFAGMARADAKLAKGAYERKYKRNRKGNNDAQRDESGMTAAHNEHVALATAEAIAELADAMETGARIASESIRKIFDKAMLMGTAERRESHGQYREQDFR